MTLPRNCSDESDSEDSFDTDSDSDSICSDFIKTQDSFRCRLLKPTFSKGISRQISDPDDCSCSFAKNVKSDIKKNVCPKCRIQYLSGSDRSSSKPILKENQPKKCCSQRMSKPSSVKFDLAEKSFPSQSFDNDFCSTKASSTDKCEEEEDTFCEDEGRAARGRELSEFCNEDYAWSPRKRWSSEDIFALCKLLSLRKSDDGLNAKLDKILRERSSCDASPGKTAASRIRSSVGNLPLHGTSKREKFLLKSSCAPVQQQYNMTCQAFKPVMRRRSAPQTNFPEDKDEFFIPFASPKDKSIIKSFPGDKCQFKFKMAPPQSCTSKIPLDKRCSKKFKFRFPFELRCTNSRCPKHVQEKQLGCEFKSDDKCGFEKERKCAKPRKSKSGLIGRTLSRSCERIDDCEKNPSDSSVTNVSICSAPPKKKAAPPCPVYTGVLPPPPAPQLPDCNALVCTPCSLSTAAVCLPAATTFSPPQQSPQVCYDVKKTAPPKPCALDKKPAKNACQRTVKSDIARCVPVRVDETLPSVSSTFCCTLCGKPSKSVASSKTMCSCIQLSQKRPKCDQCDRGCNLLTALLHSFILLLLAAATVLVLVWAFLISKYPGVSLGQNASYYELLNLHAILMLLGFVTLMGFAMIVYRLGQCCRHGCMKFLHFTFHGLAIPCMVLGFYAVYEYHAKDTDKYGLNFQSLHSWAGIIALSMFFFQFVVGFLAFVLLNCCESLTSGFRNGLIPIHSALGIVTFTLGIMACLTGLTQRMLMKAATEKMEDISFYFRAKIDEFEERLFVNVIATILILLTILMPLSLTRKNNDEAQILTCIERC